MTDQGSRYDRMAAGYARHWAPVLTPSVAHLLDVVAPSLTGRERILDLGTGTAQLAIATLERWPGAAVVGVDPSSAMLEIAVADADARLGGDTRARFEAVGGTAGDLPFEDASFDVVLSSFVLQLVPSRARALREARRVLRPNGLLGYVSWLVDRQPFKPDDVFDRVLDEHGFEPPEWDGRTGDLPSVERAANELRRAGFARVEATSGRLSHRFSVDGYLAFLTEFDEETLFAEMDPDLHRRVVADLRAGLGRLSPAQMTMHASVVYATGRRSR